MTVRWHLNAAEIEAESFRIIEQECTLHESMPLEQWRVARRLIHTTADMSIVQHLRFQHDAIASAKEALLRKAPIFCDSNMIKAGLSLARLQVVNPTYTKDDLYCHIADPDVCAEAKRLGTTRALCSAEKARPILHGAIVLIGNAPLALARITRYILEENIRPALVIGMPVGFVNVIESKELLSTCPVPHILLEGRRGGSALAVTTLHAIMEYFTDEAALFA